MIRKYDICFLRDLPRSLVLSFRTDSHFLHFFRPAAKYQMSRFLNRYFLWTHYPSTILILGIADFRNSYSRHSASKGARLGPFIFCLFSMEIGSFTLLYWIQTLKFVTSDYEGRAERKPTLELELERGLFKLTLKTPALEPLFHLPPQNGNRCILFPKSLIFFGTFNPSAYHSS